MAGLRIHTVMPQELVDRIDSAASSLAVSRGEFVRRAVEQALGSSEVPVGVRGRVPALPPAEQPQSKGVMEFDADGHISRFEGTYAAPRVRSSSVARPFRPVPKKGQK